MKKITILSICFSILVVVGLSGYDRANVRAQFFYEVNRIRAADNLTRLDYNEHMEKYSVMYALLCMDRGDIYHNLLLPGEVVWFSIQYGFSEFDKLGEVLMLAPMDLMDNGSMIVQMFMKSPGHKEVLMNPDAVALSTALVINRREVYFVAHTGVKYE